MISETPILVPTYVGFAPKLNGTISDHSWSLVESITGFQLIGGRGLASQQTYVRVCYDRSALYLRFECLEDQIDKLMLDRKQDNLPVWRDDSVEVQISPYSVASNSTRHRFVVNALGAKTYRRPDWVRENENWRASARILSDRWIAEMVIPFETIEPLGRNDECWRIAMCRRENPHDEYSTWSPCQNVPCRLDEMGRLIPPAAAYRFTKFRGKPTPIKTESSARPGLLVVSGPARRIESVDRVIPEPQEAHRRPSRSDFVIRPESRIVVNDDPDEIDLWTARELNNSLSRMGLAELDIATPSEVGLTPTAAEGNIVIGEGSRNRLLRAVCEKDEVRMPRASLSTGANVVDVMPERVVVAGQNKCDTYYGVQTLKQLLKKADDGRVSVPSIYVRDFPRFAFRGVHLYSSRDALSYIGKLIERVLAPLKINHILLQTERIAWDSCPSVIDESNFMPKDDVRQLVEIARKHHINITPAIETPGHFDWVFRDERYLDFCEDPENPFCYCMSNESAQKFVRNLLDEIVDLFAKPTYVHIGRDEFVSRGRYPADSVCAEIGREKLFFQDILRIRDYLRSKGCQTMMCGSMAAAPLFREHIDSLPRDIVITEWVHSPSEVYPTVNFYQSRGFQVIGTSWYDPRNILSYSRYAAKRGILGMLQTTWTYFRTEEEILRLQPQHAYAHVLAAAWSWNPVKPSVENLPYRPSAEFHRMFSGEDTSPEIEYRFVNIESYCNMSRIDSGRTLGWLGLGRGNDLRGIPEGIISIGKRPYLILPARLDSPAVIMLGADGPLDQFPRSVTGIRVDDYVKGLCFLHGTAYGDDYETEVGAITINYEDGESHRIPLLYERNIAAWDDQTSGMSYQFAWRGKAQDGRTVGICELSWTNERPDHKVLSIDLAASSSQAPPFFLAITAEMLASVPSSEVSTRSFSQAEPALSQADS